MNARPRLIVAALALAGLVTFVACLHVTRGMTFYYDDWTFAANRRAWNADALLQPHNEHLMLVTALLYKISWELFGAAYTPLRIVVTLEHVALGVLLFAYARRRVGDELALGATLLLLFLGTGAEVILWPVNTGFLTALVGLLVALLALDAGTRRGDVCASVAVMVALASSSAGIPVLIGVAVEVLARPDRRARWWIVVAPAVVYGAWRLGYHPGSGAPADNKAQILSYGADSAASAMGGLLALSIDWGRVLLVTAVFGAVRKVLGPGGAPPRVLGLLAVPLAFWALAALSRAQLGEPGASRYVYVGGFLILLAAVELGRGTRLPDWRAALLVAGVVALAVLGGAYKLRDTGRTYRDHTKVVAAELAAADVARDVNPAAIVDPALAPQISIGAYEGIRAGIGRVGWSPAELRNGPVNERVDADAALARYENLAAAAAPECHSPRPLASTVTLAPGTSLTFSTAAGVHLRRFAPVAGAALGGVPAGQPVTLAVPRDAAPEPWVVSFDGAAQRC